jgi:carbon storage regulator
MLVLSRKPGERIYVGDEIIVKILSIQDRYLQIGITAPESIQILRDDAICKRKRDLTGHIHPALLARNPRKNEL